jgi:hypothetical protein
LTASGDRDDIRGLRERLPLLIGLLLAAVIVALMLARVA